MESCLELALEGERLCKRGDYSDAVSYFEAAMRAGTEDLQILSAIYSQIGNAYFQLANYAKALEFHSYDLTLTRTIGDQLGEAKASGNLGNTLKVSGRFEEAIFCCQRQLDISKACRDKVGEARALYNLGNMYHAKGKSICQSGSVPGGFPEEAMTALQAAANFYEINLLMVKEMGDRVAQGRVYGNLGNTYYLLGNYGNAVVAHDQRLLIAKELGDKAAQRRACSNLGNACIFLGEFELAAQHYKRMLQLAQQLQDLAGEAQALYSLGNTYTLLQDHGRAVDCHLKHLVIARHLNDKVGEGRACWSLWNTYTALGNHGQALYFAENHLEISKETGDQTGEQTARMNISDLQVVLGLRSKDNDTLLPKNLDMGHDLEEESRKSMDNTELVKISPDKDKTSLAKASSRLPYVSLLQSKMHKSGSSSVKDLQTSNINLEVEDDIERPGQEVRPVVSGHKSFFDPLCRFLSNHVDDRRCAIQDNKMHLSAPCSPTSPTPSMKKSLTVSVCSHHERFLDMMSGSQGQRLDKPLGNMDLLPKPRGSWLWHQSILGHLIASDTNHDPTENFFNAVIKCQRSRLDDQKYAESLLVRTGPTIPDEDFFILITRAQAKRTEEQGAAFLPLFTSTPGARGQGAEAK